MRTVKTMFSVSPFTRDAVDPTVSYAVPSYKPRMGQFGELLEDVTESLDINSLIGGISDLLGQLPGDIGESYQQKLNECQRESNPLRKFRCLRDLYREIRDSIRSLREREQEISVRPTLPTAQPTAPAREFPIVPVAIAAAAGVLLIFALSR